MPPKSLLTPVVPKSAFHPSFKHIVDAPTSAPARVALEELFQDFVDVDGGKFVKDFQTAGFDARLFELFLDCVFRFEGYRRDVAHARPDFILSGGGHEFCVEAVTLNPTGGKAFPPSDLSELDLKRRTAEEKDSERLHLLPVLIHEALGKKLAKRYWDLPQAGSKPLIIALQNFSERFSHTHTSGALVHLLYGVDFRIAQGESNGLQFERVELQTHQRGGRNVPSKFFENSDTRNLSAVLFTNSGTISKFNRFEYRRNRLRYPQIVGMVRFGHCHVHGPDALLPQTFTQHVGEDGSTETWCEGLTLLHNPKAAFPLDPRAFPDACHIIQTLDGELLYSVPDFYPYWSSTFVLRARVKEDAVQR